MRPFESVADYEGMVDYFLGGGEAFLRGMGVDPAKLPTREAWLESALLDHARPDAQKSRAYLAWLVAGKVVGHSSISRIRVGEDAYIHLHLWQGGERRRGLGRWFFLESAREFGRSFGLKRLYCEPYAHNAAPNRTLAGTGFRLVKQYRTSPGAIHFEQELNLYVLEDPAQLEQTPPPGP